MDCKDSVSFKIDTIKGLGAVVVNKTNSCPTVSTGSVTVSTAGNPPVAFKWSPAGGNLPTATNLAPGLYSVFIKDSKGCKDTLTVSLGTTVPIAIASTVNDISCFGKTDGSVSMITTGTPPLIYSWVPPVANGSVANGLSKGTYMATVKDSFGCQVKNTFKINEPLELTLKVRSYNTTCGFKNGRVIPFISGGTTPYHFAWSTGQTTDSITNLPPGDFQLTVTDSNDCSASYNAIRIGTSVSLRVSLGENIDLCPGDSITISPGTYFSYLWQDGSKLPHYIATHSGIYAVTVTDTTGCKASSSIAITPTCRDILFPDAFTPNGDGHNDTFGPLGTLHSVKDYSLNIFNRWGISIFSTTNPYQKWDGKINNANAAPGTYIWIAKYAFNGNGNRVKKGTIIILR